MKKLIVLATLALLAGCAHTKIPDDIPPAPPVRTGEPIRAPALATEGDAAPADDGFGGDGFGGETPAVEADAAPEEGAQKKAEPKKDDAKKAEPKKDAKKKEGDAAKQPTTQPSEAETPK